MWSVADGRLLWSRDDVPTSWLALSPDGRYLATEEFSSEAGDTAPDGAPVSSRLRLWDLATRTAVMDDPLPGEVADDGLHTPKPRFVTFSPDSTLLAAGFFNPLEVLTVYDVAARARTATYEGPGVTVSSGAFTPDSGRLLVRDNDGVVRVLVPRTGQVESTYATHRSSYSALGFTADGSMLVYASDTTLDVVDATTKAPILLAVPNPVTNGDAAVAVTSDGYVFLTSDRGVLRLDVDPGRWKAKACAIADRPLTQEEWARYLPGRPYTPACVPAGATLAPSPTSST
jgi:WD40 repeat protein